MHFILEKDIKVYLLYTIKKAANAIDNLKHLPCGNLFIFDCHNRVVLN